MRSKNRTPLPFQIMTTVFWIGGEFAGGFIWGVMQALNGGPPKEMDLTVYLFCLIGAGIGAGISFLIAWLVPSAQPQPSPFGYGQPPYGYGGPNFSAPRTSGNPYNPYDPSTPPQPQPPRNPFSDR